MYLGNNCCVQSWHVAISIITWGLSFQECEWNKILTKMMSFSIFLWELIFKHDNKNIQIYRHNTCHSCVGQHVDFTSKQINNNEGV